jgi:hypothetical protein
VLLLLGCAGEKPPETSYYVADPPEGTDLGEEGEALLAAAMDTTCNGVLEGVEVNDFRAEACLDAEPSLVVDDTVYWGRVAPKALPGCGPSAVVEVSASALARTAVAYVAAPIAVGPTLCEKSFMTVAVWVDHGEGFVLDEFGAAVGVERSGTTYCFFASVKGGPASSDRVWMESAANNSFVVSIHDDPTVQEIRLVLGSASGCDPMGLDVSFGPERTVYQVGDNGE